MLLIMAGEGFVGEVIENYWLSVTAKVVLDM